MPPPFSFFRRSGREAPARLEFLVDTHCHILPALDDGATDLETCLEMARAMVAAGYTDIIATPHWREGVWMSPADEIRRTVETVNAELERQGVPLTVHPGNEVFLGPAAEEGISSDALLTMGDRGSHVLVELPLSGLVPGFAELSFRLQTTGRMPILAHPERYRTVQDDPDLVEEWVDGGCLMQLDLGSLAGMNGRACKRCSAELLERRLFHVAGTDLHDLCGDPDLPTRLVEALVKTAGRDRALRLLHDNPRSLLSGTRPGEASHGQ